MQRILERIAGFVSWHRRVVGGVLVALAVVLIVEVLSAPSGPTVDVTMARTALPAGHVLTDSDLEVRAIPPDLAPEASLGHSVTGRALAAGVAAGTILQPGLIAGEQAAEPGRAVVPITVSDERLRGLLLPGTAVTLVVTMAETAEVLTSDARVATLPTQAASGSALELSTTRQSQLVLVNVPAGEAAVVASLGQSGQLTVILGTV